MCACVRVYAWVYEKDVHEKIVKKDKRKREEREKTRENKNLY